MVADASAAIATPGEARVSLDGDRLRCSGAWTAMQLADAELALDRLAPPDSKVLHIDLNDVGVLDTAGAWLILRLRRHLESTGVSVTVSGFDDDEQRLLELVERTGMRSGELPVPREPGFLEGIGRDTREQIRVWMDFLAFIGKLTFVALRILLTPARMRWRMVWHELEESGFNALPIVGLLTFLVGVVIAYQGGVTLRNYGAGIFIADMVGLSMLRELAPLITAIIVAGRTGSAYTAQIGTMKVTEEVDALRTMGITPLEMLALPKLFALIIAMPLLTVFADVMGVLGGMVMAKAVLGVQFTIFIDRFMQAVTIESYLIGLGKAPVFAGIIAAVGCYQGFQVRGGADSVGERTTVSVVQSIFLVIVVDAIFSIIFSRLGL